MKKILMCPPESFAIEYEINPWMKIGNMVDKEKAFKSYNELKAAYQNLGVEVFELKPQKGFPDMIYTANIGYAEKNVFIKANFKFEQRRPESDFAKDFFEEKDFRIFTLPEDIYFEGEGDLIRSSHKYFLGWGKRTDLKAKNFIEDILQKEIIDLELIDPFYYHLDTCFAPLNDNAALINRNSFTENGMQKIYDNFETVIEVDANDNSQLACNLVVVDSTVILGKRISAKLEEQLNKLNFRVTQIDMCEFLKGGGSVKCLSQEIFD